ncbi:ATP-binding protein [Methanoregula sp.]|uniref:ATP-binding protein n=1 Tax=Methanoregula sp. TaxID=2052170 RepID=UPI003C744E33
MSLLSHQKQTIYDIGIIASVIVAIIITYVCLNNGIYEVFPYLYLIPVVLIAYTRPKFGIYGTVLVGWLYFVLVYFWEIPDSQLFTLATIRFYVFVSIGILISVFSQEYRKGEQKNHTLYNHSQAGIFSINKKTLEITDANRKFAQIIHYQCSDLIKKNLSDIITGSEERESFLANLHDFCRVEDIEVFLSARDGPGRWVLISASHTDEENIVCTVVDITDQKESQRALMLANRKLLLLSSITRHDILNKLSGIYGYLGILRMKFPDPALADYISKLEDTTKKIQALIAETQVYQDLGTQEPKWQELDKIARDVQVPATIALIVDLQGVEVFADPMLKKVFSNFLDNSLRHGERVTEIRVSSQKSGEDLIVVWEDNGVGIAAEEKERIFEWGFGKNTGLGMFLIREILSLTSITIKETGQPGKGVQFEITVPEGQYRFTRVDQK